MKDAPAKEMKYRGVLNVKDVIPTKHPIIMSVSALNHTKETTKQKNANQSVNPTKLSYTEGASIVLPIATILGIIFVLAKQVISTRTRSASKSKLLLVLQVNIF